MNETAAEAAMQIKRNVVERIRQLVRQGGRTNGRIPGTDVTAVAEITERFVIIPAGIGTEQVELARLPLEDLFLVERLLTNNLRNATT